MYTLELDEARIKTYVTGLDSYIKVIATQLLNGGNSPAMLRNFLPQLISINDELMKLDQIIDNSEAK